MPASRDPDERERLDGEILQELIAIGANTEEIETAVEFSRRERPRIEATLKRRVEALRVARYAIRQAKRRAEQ